MGTMRKLFILSLIIILSGCAGLNPERRRTVDGLRINAEEAIAKVKSKLRDNPESAIENSLAILDQVLNYADTVKSDPEQFNPDKIQEYIEKINIINENIERFSDLTLQGDVSFPLGKYRLADLSDNARTESDKLIDNIVHTVGELAVKYPRRTIKINLKILGYTDETPFNPGTDLEKAILAKLDASSHISTEERRRKYNEVLSAFRASSLSEYITGELERKVTGKYKVMIEAKSVGQGESLPNKRLSYTAKDERRRICIISPFIEILI